MLDQVTSQREGVKAMERRTVSWGRVSKAVLMFGRPPLATICRIGRHLYVDVDIESYSHKHSNFKPPLEKPSLTHLGSYVSVKAPLLPLRQQLSYELARFMLSRGALCSYERDNACDQLLLDHLPRHPPGIPPPNWYITHPSHPADW